jgi:hypothetical protein
VFGRPEKIYEAASRGHGFTSIESRQDLDTAVALGRGGIWLELDMKQYQELSHQSNEDALRTGPSMRTQADSIVLTAGNPGRG